MRRSLLVCPWPRRNGTPLRLSDPWSQQRTASLPAPPATRADHLLRRFAPVDVDRIGVGQHHEQVRVQLAREQLGGEVLVDHALPSHQLAVRTRLVSGRDASAAGRDHDGIAFEQPFDGAQLEDALGLGRGHHAPPFVAVLLEHPALLLGEAVGFLLRVDRPDELGRV